jgi:hypothetical protein
MLKTEKPEQNPKKNKKRSIWLISSFAIVIVFVAAFWYNKDFLNVYYFNLKRNHFKVNDKLYADKFTIDKTIDLFLFRRVKPVSGNLRGRPYMAMSGWSISSDSLCKYKTARIGTYTGYEIQSITGSDNKYTPMLFFSITTNKKVLIKNSLTDPPAGYQFDDGPLYVWGFQVTGKEVHAFRKIK